MTDIRFINPEAIKNLPTSGCIILDVRTNMEHAGQHLECPHLHIPLDQLNVDDFIQTNKISADSQLYILCHSGKRAETAANQFVKNGISNVHVISGGITACQGCGIAIKSESSAPISLERQVRIVAGLLIAIGSILALFFDAAFVALPLFVGCGLVFAGITNKCGMALLLTKAPWNKV
jgi:rhodanese-related sulfurtransferase